MDREWIRNLLSYDQDTGILRWAISRGNKRCGEAAGTLSGGYVSVRIDRKCWHHRKKHHLGRFDCPAAAQLAYIIAADKMHGEFARVK